MDVAINHKSIKPCELRRINYCRLYLNVVLLSDICTAGGNRIDESMYWGNLQQTPSTCTHHAATQQNPNGKAWKAWRKLLHLFCRRSSRELKHQYLLSWTVPRAQQRRQWPVLYDQDSNQIFCKVDQGWTQHEMMYYHYDATPSQIVDEPPASAAPCDYSRNQHNIRMILFHDRDIPVTPPPPTSLQTVVPTLEPWESHLLSDLEWTVPETAVWQALRNSQCIFASDGSAPKSKGSFAWILSDDSGNRLVQCSGPVFGHRISSYRAEGYGILSVLRFLYHMHQIYSDSTGPKPELKSDSKSMIQVIHRHQGYAHIFPNATMASDWDVIAEITQTLKTLTDALTPTLSHIKGHQDRTKSYDKLPLRAQLNIDADKLAEQWLQQHQDFDHSQVPILPTSGCQLHLTPGTITHNLKQELVQARTANNLRKHLCKKFEWDDATFEDVDWTNHGIALKRLGKHRKTLVKYLHSFTPVGVRAHMYDKRYPPECPSCGFPQETTHHLIHCPKRKEQREQWYKAILDYTTKQHTYPPLQDLIMSAMRAQLDDQPDDSIDIPAEVQEAANAQAAIGWRQLFKGRLSKQWTLLQDRHLGSQRTDQQNGDTWMAGLIQTMLQQWYNLWTVRNADRHGRDWRTTQASQHRQAIREVTQLYDQYKDNILDEHNWLFDTPLLTRIQQPTASLRQWINSWKHTMEESYQTRLETG